MQKIIYFSIIDWFFTKQRPQHFAEALSKKYEVHYISLVGWKSKIKNTHTADDSFPRYKKIGNLHIHRLRLLPGHRIKFINIINNYIIKIYLIIRVKYGTDDWLWITHPYQFTALKKSKNRVFYDCMDYYEGFIEDEQGKTDYLTVEKYLILSADKIITSSTSLYYLLKEKGGKEITIVNNAAEFEHFRMINVNTEAVTKRKIIGYFGGMGNWFDIKTINLLAQHFPNLDFHLIGPQTHEEIFTGIELSQNVLLLGSKPYVELPKILNQFDVCLYLFNELPLVQFVNPVKIYEYMAQGKPVISINNTETRIFGSLIYRGNNLEDHKKNLVIALNETEERNLATKRIAFAGENTWQKRCDAIFEVIDE